MTEYYDIGSRKCRVHEVTCEQREEASQAGIARRNLHSSYGSKKHWHDERSGEYSDEIYGCLGEILFRDVVKKNDLQDVSYFPPLYVNSVKDLAMLPPYDAKIEEKKIEVKSIPPGENKRRLLVKLKEYKKVDFYVAVKFVSDNKYIFAGFCTDKELKINEPFNFKYTTSYWIFLTNLRHMKREWWKLEED